MALEVAAARYLFSGSCRFLYAVTQASTLPGADLPEVAFVGRSNVGKSSLINAMTRRNSLARTSRTPGCTQQINFFDLARRLVLVDLPGYGFARQSKETLAAWTQLIRLYLTERVSLRRVCLLIDARHGLKQSDQEIMTILTHSGVSLLPILTKCDKIKPTILETTVEETKIQLQAYPTAFPQPVITSAVTAEGLSTLRREVWYLARDTKEPKKRALSK